MSKMFLISAAAGAVNGEFFRAGRKWTKEGVVVSQSEFTDAQWAVLLGEKMLHITPAADGAAAQAAQEDTALRAALKATILVLAPSDFEADGKPKLDALKERHPEFAKQITAKLLAGLWAELIPPKEPK